MRRRLSKREIEEIIELRRRGLTLGEIARRLGVSMMAVSYWLKRFDIPKPPSKMERIKEEILELVWRYGYITQKDVVKIMAEKYGISECNVYTCIAELRREGKINTIRLTGSGMRRRPTMLSRVLRKANLSKTVFLYTDESIYNLAWYLASLFLLNLPKSTNFKHELRGLKLSLKNRLPQQFYELVCRYLKEIRSHFPHTTGSV